MTVTRPKSSAERWAYLVEDAKRIMADRTGHSSKEERRWAADTLAVHESGHRWHGGQMAAGVKPLEPAAATKPPIIMKPPITQTELADVAARFRSVLETLREFEGRSDPEAGGSVEPGELRLDTPVVGEYVDLFEHDFKDMFISR